MSDLSLYESYIQIVNSFQDLISIPFQGRTNAISWKRDLVGDFSEIIRKIKLQENIHTINETELLSLNLTEQGQLAREILINDLMSLKAHGASPVLNLIKNYDRDDFFFSTDVYSFHVDRSPIPIHTFLCTYHGEPSEIIPNSQAKQKILIPEIRAELKKLYDGPDSSFEAFLTEHFFDLHYQSSTKAKPHSLGNGNIWKLAVDHPESKVLPCIHRAPSEKTGQVRLLLIC